MVSNLIPTLAQVVSGHEVNQPRHRLAFSLCLHFQKPTNPVVGIDAHRFELVVIRKNGGCFFTLFQWRCHSMELFLTETC